MPTEVENAIIQTWIDAKADASLAVSKEREAREAVIQLCFVNPCYGTNTYELGQGYKLKLQRTLNYDLGNKDLVVDGQKVSIQTQIDAVLDEIDALGEGGAALALRLVRWKPELATSEYKALNTEFSLEAKVKELIDAVLTTKDNSPQLSFEEPKKNGST